MKPRMNRRIAPAMLTTMDWMMMTMTAAVPASRPRETPVMDAKIRTGMAEKTTRQERNAYI